MSKYLRIPAILLLLLALFSSCEKTIEKGSLQINIDQGTELKSVLDSVYGDIPAAVFISIMDESGEYVLNMKRLPLIKMGDSYLTEHIELTTGNYTVEDFIVVNGEDTVLYLTPKEDSEFAEYVRKPLPVSFQVKSEETTFVVLEVLPAHWGEPADYGYAVFSFSIVTPFCSNLLLYIPAEDSIADMSGNDVPLMPNGVQVAQQEGNGVLCFDGQDELIVNGNAPIIASPSFTICTWVYLNGPGYGYQYPNNPVFQQRGEIASYDSKSLVFLTAESKTRRVEFSLRASDNQMGELVIIKGDTLEYNRWYHIAATFDRQRTMRLYIDGRIVADSVLNQEGDFITDICHVSLGAHTYKYRVNGAFNGNMDDFRIYDRSLCPRDIKAVMEKW